MKTASDCSSETVSLFNSKRWSSLYSTSSIDEYLKWESKDSSYITSTSSSQIVAQFYIVTSKPIQTSSNSRARWKSSSIYALLRRYTQPILSIFGILPSSLSYIPRSLRPSSVIETSITIHSDPRHTHPIGDQGSVFLFWVLLKLLIFYITG